MLSSPQRVRAIRAASTISCLLGLLASPALQAAEPAKAAAKPAKETAAKAKTPLLTRDELRTCMATGKRLAQQREETVQLQTRIADEKQALARTGDELKEQYATMDRTNQELVAKYVEAHNAREKRIEAFQAEAAQFNAKAESLNAAQTAYREACENRRYDEKDEIAIRQGK